MKKILTLTLGAMLLLSAVAFASPSDNNDNNTVWRPALIGGSSTQTDGHGNYRG